MQIPEILMQGLQYIEQNLKTELSADELAALAGYSVFHYCHLFADTLGMPVAGYIQKRRIDHALAEISRGRKAIDVVLEYGFDTYSGFYKAFIRLYGCSPRKYQQLYPGTVSRPLLPEVSTIMYTEKELRQVLSHWDIDPKLPIENIYLMTGAKVPGKDWRVGEEYLLRAGDRQSLVKNRSIAKALANQGFQALLPIPTCGGADFLDGAEPFFLTRGLQGKPLDKAERFGEKRLEFGTKYGGAVARLHNALQEVQRDFPADEVNLYDTIINWALPNVQKQDEQWGMDLGDTFFEDYKQRFGELYPHLQRQLIHRNPNPTTILFHEGDVAGFIDFEMTEINVRLWDPCYCATGILCEGPNHFDKWIEVLHGIIKGYDHQAHLNEAEKQAIFYVLCSIQMICVAYFQGIDKPEFRQLSKTNRDMLMFIAKERAAIEKIF